MGIMKKGEMGNEMFFIMKGSCDVLIDDDLIQVVAVKNIGDYFGEVALVFDCQTRTAWVRARTFCLLAKLKKSDFELTLASVPDVKRHMIANMQLPPATKQ